MINPLRCPIVLIALLAIMVAYVHLSHRHRQRAQESVASEAESLKLRTSSPAESGSVLRTRRGNATPSGTVESTDPLPLPGAPVATPTDPASLRSARAPIGIEGAESEAGEHGGPSSPGLSLRPIESRRVVESPIRNPPAIEKPLRPVFVRGQKTPATYSRRFTVRDDSSESSIVMHRVVDGDTLELLALKYLGKESRYMEIFQANRHLLVRPDLLPLGELLRIPEPD